MTIARNRCLARRQIISSRFYDAEARLPFPLWMNSERVDDFRNCASHVWRGVDAVLLLATEQKNGISKLAGAISKGYADDVVRSRAAAWLVREYTRDWC